MHKSNILIVFSLCALCGVNSREFSSISINDNVFRHVRSRWSFGEGNVRSRRKQMVHDIVASNISEYLRLHALLAIRGGDNSQSDKIQSNKSKTKASKSNPKQSIKHSSSKRGTRTTGAGASKRNPSVFSIQNSEESKHSTAAALAGDMLNRQSNEEFREDKNPMTGRLWAKLSDEGTLVLKIPSNKANEQPIYIELSECDHEHKNTTKLQKGLDGSISPKQSVRVQHISIPNSLEKLAGSTSNSFIPLEGIYGIYNLPCSGPHAVLITESEEIYSSPLSTKSLHSMPLLELRRIKSLEIVPLRSKMIDKLKQASVASEEQVVEEARQLRLLRNSFKEHDFYFTVPRKVDSIHSSPIVQDVTHSLQRAFLYWSLDRRQSNKFTAKENCWWGRYAGTYDPQHHAVDSRFFWNEEPALALLHPVTQLFNKYNTASETAVERLLDQVIPVCSAFVGVERNIPFPSSTLTSKSNEAYDQLLISRRSKFRTGTRFTRRGADDTGAVANYAETEQICFINARNNTTNESGWMISEVYSHIQTRGSIPLHWSSPANVKAYRPRVFIGVDPTTQARALRDHLLGELTCYTTSLSKKLAKKEHEQVKLAMVNLIDKHGDQGRLGNTFDSVLSAVLDVYGSDQSGQVNNSDINTKQQPQLDPKSVEHIWYDFHAECKGGRWNRLSNLLDKISPTLSSQGYFCAAPNVENEWKIINLQDGVVRTNCVDCLDRTNVVQSMFGRYMLFNIFQERIGLSASTNNKMNARKRPLPTECILGFKQKPLCLPWAEGESSHRNLWADNADAISRLYAGTPALKGDFTRTGVRTKRGALDDGVNSIQRYYLNNFIDADRQEGMDLLVGSTDFNEYAGEYDEMSRVFMLQELADGQNRRHSRNHRGVKTKSNRSILNGESPPLKLSLSWLPGDLRHHMKIEALQSRLPLSSAASEEDLSNVHKSSDFLMEVSSLSAVWQTSHQSRDPVEALQSIDNRVSSDRPWWAGVEDYQYPDDKEEILSCVKKSRLLIALLLAKAPVITATALAAVIAFL